MFDQDNANKQSLEFRRSIILLLPFALIFCLTLIQLFGLTILQGNQFQTIAESNRIYRKSINPIRGFIYDRNGNLLVENSVRQDLIVSPAYIKMPEKKLNELSGLLEIDFFELKRKFDANIKNSRAFGSFPLLKGLNEKQLAKLKVSLESYDGFEIQASLKRNVLHGEALAHVLGYLGEISTDEREQLKSSYDFKNLQIGKLGVEKEWDSIMRGTPGFQTQERDARGKLVRILETSGASDGESLKLSIDIELQNHLYKMFKGRKGALVAMEPDTGLIRALISSPSYNPNILNSIIDSKKITELLTDKESPMFNRAISGQYPPASTLKPFIGLAALENEIIKWDKQIQDNGEFFVDGDPRPYRGWREEGHGLVNMKKAIAESSDVYFYNLAFDLTLSGIRPMLNEFGFGKKTGLIEEESSGLLPDKKWKLGYIGDFWFKGDTINLGIGQGYILATPLQLAMAYSAIANKGKIYKPSLIEPKNIDNFVPELIHSIELNKIDRWAKMESALVDVVSAKNGTAHKIYDSNMTTIAGKTGTAQIKSILPGKEYDAIRQNPALRDHALFVGYGPVEKPSLVVSVVIENGESGSAVAAPLVKSAINFYTRTDEK